MTVAEPLRWGVIGASSQVARSAVLPAMAASERADVVAVASQSQGEALDLGPAMCDVRRYGSYDDVLADDRVEAVYVPLPNSMHLEWVCAALQAGRHVLCEKPLALSASEGQEMAEAADRHGRVLMEAYMARFHPRWQALQRLVDEGRLGQIRFARATFTFDGLTARPDDYRWQPQMGGGSLADVGVYCLAPILAAVGRMPERVAGSARWTEQGVDASFSGWLDFGSAWASVECSFELPERQLLELVGSEATAVVERAYTAGVADDALHLSSPAGTEIVRSGGADPYQNMVEHFADMVQHGRSPVYPLSESIRVARTADLLRSDAHTGRDTPAVVSQPSPFDRPPYLP